MSKLGVQKRKRVKIEMRELGELFKEGKVCTNCDEWKSLESYDKSKTGLGGRQSWCKPCRKEHLAQYYVDNKERCIRNSLKWYSDNRSRRREYDARWHRNNPEVGRTSNHRRKAREKELPATLTLMEWTETISYFDGVCALTGDGCHTLHQDHFIALATECGGTTKENMIPLAPFVNESKNNRNPFEWVRVHGERLGVTQERFNRVVEYLADLNRMTIFDYTAYVYECFAKPNEIGNRSVTDEISA